MKQFKDDESTTRKSLKDCQLPRRHRNAGARKLVFLLRRKAIFRFFKFRHLHRRRLRRRSLMLVQVIITF